MLSSSGRFRFLTFGYCCFEYFNVIFLYYWPYLESYLMLKPYVGSGAGHRTERPVLISAHQAGGSLRGVALPAQRGLAPDAVPGPVP